MIFQATIDLVLSGVKTQTTRLAYAGDTIGATAGGESAVLESPFQFAGKTRQRSRWIVGHTYAVQRERCHKAEARIKVTNLFEVPDPTAIDAAFALREGMPSVEAFLRVWHQLHKKLPVQRCWAIQFELEK